MQFSTTTAAILALTVSVHAQSSTAPAYGAASSPAVSSDAAAASPTSYQAASVCSGRVWGGYTYTALAMSSPAVGGSGGATSSLPAQYTNVGGNGNGAAYPSGGYGQGNNSVPGSYAPGSSSGVTPNTNAAALAHSTTWLNAAAVALAAALAWC